MNNEALGRYEFLNNDLSVSLGHPPMSYVLVREASETAEATQVLALALGCPTKLDSKTLLPKTPHTLVTGQREIKLRLTWKRLSWLAFTVLERVMNGTAGRKAIIDFIRCWTVCDTILTCQGRCALECNNGVSVVT